MHVDCEYIVQCCVNLFSSKIKLQQSNGEQYVKLYLIPCARKPNKFHFQQFTVGSFAGNMFLLLFGLAVTYQWYVEEFRTTFKYLVIQYIIRTVEHCRC